MPRAVPVMNPTLTHVGGCMFRDFLCMALLDGDAHAAVGHDH